jgi:hypothetical protein
VLKAQVRDKPLQGLRGVGQCPTKTFLKSLIKGTSLTKDTKLLNQGYKITPKILSLLKKICFYRGFAPKLKKFLDFRSRGRTLGAKVTLGAKPFKPF